MLPRPPISTLFPYTTLFRSASRVCSRRAIFDRLDRLEPRNRSSAGLNTAGSPASSRASSSANTNSGRSEEHTSELQSQSNLVCRLLLEKKKKKNQIKHADRN